MADDNSALVARILHGARWATVLRLSGQLISWVSTLVVVRFVSAADYGLNAMLEAPLELLFLVSTLGLDLALVRSRRVDSDFVGPVFGWLLLVNGVLFCAYFFGSPLIAAYFEAPRLQPLAQALAFLFLLVPFRVIPNAILDRQLKFKLRAGVELICGVIAAITTLVLAVLGFGVWALVTGLLVPRLLSAIILMCIQPWFARPTLSLKAVRTMLALGGTLTLASALAVTANMLPVLIAGPVLGPTRLGLYAVALQFAMLPLSKVMPIVNSIAFPAFSKFEGQPTVIGGYVAKCLGAGALVLLPVIIGLACTSEAFALAVLGPQWAEAALPLAVLSLVVPFRGVSLFLREVLGGIGYAGLKLKCSLATWIVAIPSLLVGGRFGIEGLVGAFAVTEVVTFAVALSLSRHAMVLPRRELLAAFRAPVSAVMLMAATALLCGRLLDGNAPLLVLVAQVASGAAAYGVAIRLFFWAEARQLMALIKP